MEPYGQPFDFLKKDSQALRDSFPSRRRIGFPWGAYRPSDHLDLEPAGINKYYLLCESLGVANLVMQCVSVMALS